MDFDLAAQNYMRLEKLRRSGQIADGDYRAQLEALRVTDEQGRTWMVQEQTGQWYVWDGAQWSPGVPPGREGVIRVAAPVMAAPAAAAPPPAPQPAPPVATGYTQAQQPVVYPQAGAAPPGYPPAGAPPPSYAQPQAFPQGYPQGYAQAYPQPGVGQAGVAGHVTQPVVPPNLALARKRPGCFSVTLSMLLWALVWAGAAYAVHSLLRITPWWAYVAVGLGALGTLILWVRLITRHGRALRKLSRGAIA